MTGAGVEVEGVELYQDFNAAEGSGGEGAFAVKGVEDDAFEEVSEGKVVVIGEGFEDFEEAFFDADAGLDALDGVGSLGHVYQCTMVPATYLSG